MNQTANPSENRREEERIPLSRNMRWHHRYQENQDGKIIDLSPGGFFLELAGAMPNNIRADDVIWITPKVGKQEHYLSATVRWRGARTQAHGQGFGLEFDDCSKKIVKNLLRQI